MQEAKEVKQNGNHRNALRICEDLQANPSYQCLYSEFQKLAASPNVKKDDFKNSLVRAMKESGMETELRNDVYYWIKNHEEPVESNYEGFFKKMHLQWEKRVHKSLYTMCNELGIEMAKLRTCQDRDELFETWKELSISTIELNKYKPVYSPKDFLEVLLNLKGPNYKPQKNEPKWEFSHIPLKVKELEDLRNLYMEIASGEPILGVNGTAYPEFEKEMIQLGEKIINSNEAILAQEFLKKGCPPCLRAKIWTLVLGCELKEHHYNYYENLKSHVLQYDLATDKLIYKDVHLTASNDDQYFVFEDLLHQIMLCFSRDVEIFEQFPLKTGNTYMQVTVKGRCGNTDTTIVFPPSGIIPFHGFTMYAAPFCYLFCDSVPLYFTTRAFYLKFWFRLHTISGHPQGIVSLCLLFERLLQTYDPKLLYHFKKIQMPPLRLVIKWIMRGFSGYLPPEQLLYLWDVVLAYDSLEIIPLLAVAILIFRRDNLLRVTNIGNVDAVLSDLSSICVMSLLQMALIKE